MANALRRTDTARLEHELAEECHRRTAETLEGFDAYAKIEPPPTPELPVVWSEGTTKLRYCAPVEAKHAPVLFVPSLINRYTILDLLPGASFARYLAAKGHPVWILDWDWPGEEERTFDADAYVMRRVLPALDALGTERPVLAGYCMGGLLTMAAACLAPRRVRGVALFATPWDFTAYRGTLPTFDDKQLALLEDYLLTQPEVSRQWVHLWCSLLQPWAFQRKYRRLSRLEPDSSEFALFMAVERWAGDGVAMSTPAARQCFVQWVHRNQPAQGDWRIGGTTIGPSALTVSLFAAVPEHDRIVPPASALALAREAPSITLVQPCAGHVGMMVGDDARRSVWKPFRKWVKTIG